MVVSNEAFNETIRNVTVLPLPPTVRRRYPSEVRIPAGAGGQPLDSIVMAHRVRTISRQRLGRLLGSLDDHTLRQAIQQAIREHFDLD